MHLRAKNPWLRLALRGALRNTHRFLLRIHLDHIGNLQGLIGRLSERIEAAMAPFAEAAARLTTIPGVSRRVAETVLAEIGPRREQFPTAAIWRRGPG